MDSRDLRSLSEAYSQIYEDTDFNDWVDSLIEEGYDLSEYTWEEMYEAYIQEQSSDSLSAFGGLRNQLARQGLERRVSNYLKKGSSSTPAATKSSSSSSLSAFSGLRNQLARQGLERRVANYLRGEAPTKPKSEATPPFKSKVQPRTRPIGPTPKPAATSGTTAKTAPVKPAAPAPGTKAAGPESIKPKTPNPLLRDNKISDMIAASKARQTGQNTTSTQIASNRASSLQTASSNLSGSGGLAKTAPKKVAEDIASAYASIYEAKKVDQDQDGNIDFADVRIARMIASGMSRAEAIAAVKNKEYNEEAEVDNEIYEETLQQKKEREERQNERRARIAELQAQGRVMTSSKRASQKVKQRKEAQREEELEKRGENVLRQITGTSGKVSEKPMGSEGPKEKEAAPEATRKLHKGLRKDNLGTAADKVLRQVKNEDFELWVNELLNEGYDIEDWTEEELYDLYEEILDEKYGTAAGRKRVVKMARAGKDIGKKGPGFENMVKKLTPKYGKERATKIAAAQMFKTHA